MTKPRIRLSCWPRPPPFSTDNRRRDSAENHRQLHAQCLTATRFRCIRAPNRTSTRSRISSTPTPHPSYPLDPRLLHAPPSPSPPLHRLLPLSSPPIFPPRPSPNQLLSPPSLPLLPTLLSHRRLDPPVLAAVLRRRGSVPSQILWRSLFGIPLRGICPGSWAIWSWLFSPIPTGRIRERH